MILQVNDIRYFVEVKGEGEPLVFLHGFTGDTTTWSRITDRLSSTFTCVSIDLIGHGRTEAPEDFSRYTMDHVSNDLDSILSALEVDQAIFIGYSMGGRTALHFAMRYPQKVKALILESASPGLKTGEERMERRKKDHALADRIMREGMEAFVDFWEEIPLFASQKRLNDEERAEIRKQRLGQSPLGLSNSLKGMGTGAQDSWWDKLAGLSIPVHLLVGEMDQKFVQIAKEMKKLNPDFQITTISNTGHAIHVEEPRKFGTIIEELLLTT
ncbi:2-succinyl-6-hydroxy-2,4-cyclohexadiene-1-carboxylate synthase [Rossellomorea aquimaris]|uniref:2-succinyl-6-hydroxy-2, 4-cyclohexadiene-1-carboxylate synthase n=1 Tax=Rossellomorea aquimaris TaxID=189382 RepID=UPI0005C994A7|nr:2-succinyl-6-hydroxy-2,4-cyclohexadiene-1-carboxylate synthase [Rossellomorea aquimaris]